MGPLLALCILSLIPMGCFSQACRPVNPTPAIREDEKPGIVVTALIIDPEHTVEVSATKFGINGKDLILTEEVDYEVEKIIKVILICKKNGLPVPGTTFFVEIVNVNDNAPVFKEASYSFNILENLQVNSAIGPAIAAEDADQDTLYYTLIGNDMNATAYFRLSSITNPVLLVNKPLDYDLYPHIRMNLTARDTQIPEDYPSFTATTSIIIDIIDADDKPPFFQPCSPIGTKICISNGYKSSVNRSEPATQPLQLMPGPLYAVDGDYSINDPISYSVTSGNENSVFSINAANGNITMDKSVDTLGTILLQVMAYQANDIQKYAITTVQIEVKEKNNFPPIFIMSNYYGTISTNADIGSFVRNSSDQTKVLQVFAADRDFSDGFNPAVTYKIENSTDFIVVRDGYILTNSVFTSPGTSVLLVSAADTATSERTTTLVTMEITQALTSTTTTSTTTTTTLSTLTTTKSTIAGTGTTTTTTPSTRTTTRTTPGTGTTTTTTPSTRTTTRTTTGTGTTTTTTPSTLTTTSTTPGTGTTTTTTPSARTTTSTTTGTGTTTTTTPSTLTTTSTTPGTGTTTTTTPSTRTTTSTTPGTGTTTTTTPSTRTTTSTTTGTGTTTTTTPSTRTTTSTTPGTGTTTTTTPSTRTTTSTTTGTGTTTTTTPSTRTTTSTTTGTGTTTTTTPSTRTTTSTTTGTGTTTTTTPSTRTTTSTNTGTGTTTTPSTRTTTSTTTGTGTTTTTTPSTLTTSSTTTGTGTTTTPSTQTSTSITAGTGTVTASPTYTATSTTTGTGTITRSTTNGTGNTTKNPEPGTEGVLPNANYYTTTDMTILGATLGVVLALSLVGLAFLIYKQYGNTIRSKLNRGSGNNSGGSGDSIDRLINEEDNLSISMPSNLDSGINGDIIEVSSEINLLSAAAVSSVLSRNAPAESQPTEEDGGSDSEDKKVKSILTKDLKEDGGYKSVWFREDAAPEVMVIEGVESGEANDDDTEELSNQQGDDDDDEEEEEEDEDELDPTFNATNNTINSNNITIL